MPGGRRDDIEYYNSWHNTEVTIVGVYQEQGWFTSDIKVICETSSGQIHRTTIGHLVLLPNKCGIAESEEVVSYADGCPEESAPAVLHETAEHLGE